MKTLGVFFWNEQNWHKRKLTKKIKIAKDSYALFSRIGKSKGFRVIISSRKYYGNGKFKKAYEYSHGKFNVVRDQKVDIIFDRSWESEKRNKNKKKFMKKISMFNNPELNRICWDKYLCSKIFNKFMDKNFLVHNKSELRRVVKKLDSEKIVLKPRFGVMGLEVKIVKRNKLPEVRKNTIVQKFIDSSNGIKTLGIKGVHDLRIVTLSNKIDHAYVRRPRKGLIANIAQGGYVTHINKKKLPKEVLNIVKNIDKRMKRYGPRLYTVDMIFDEKNKPIVTELESNPVIDSAYKSSKSKKTQREFMKHIFDSISKLS
tara:strand:- start:13572 stop:14516 length:945 start_codon:yes stop_codon:yes gene_type:complete